MQSHWNYQNTKNLEAVEHPAGFLPDFILILQKSPQLIRWIITLVVNLWLPADVGGYNYMFMYVN